MNNQDNIEVFDFTVYDHNWGIICLPVMRYLINDLHAKNQKRVTSIKITYYQLYGLMNDVATKKAFMFFNGVDTLDLRNVLIDESKMIPFLKYYFEVNSVELIEKRNFL